MNDSVADLIKALEARTADPSSLAIHTKLQLLRKIEAVMVHTSPDERLTLENLRERLL